MHLRPALFAVLLLLVCVSGNPVLAATLHVGAASVDVTPPEPVALNGQFNLRVSKAVETPMTVNALAIEAREGQRSIDLAVLVSCDIVSLWPDMIGLVRDEVAKRLPGIDAQKVVLCATHTHTGPTLELNKYPQPKQGCMAVEAYRALFINGVATAVEKAWKAREPALVTWGLGHAVVAYNRRAVYADGKAKMYGATTGAEFQQIEGYEDHDVGSLFFWNKAGKLNAVAVNVSCPAQEVESRSTLNADYWHPVRELLHKRFGAETCIVGLIGAAGDQSPHIMYRKAADERMRELRHLDRLGEIARRLERAVEETYAAVADDRHADVPFAHKVATLQLPMRRVTDAEYAETRASVDAIKAQMAAAPKKAATEFRRMQWYNGTLARYERQKTEKDARFATEVHVIRLGDALICTNPFELFTDYGIRMKARSPAVQTFVVQLAGGGGGYLPTERAVRGGSYSAIIHSTPVGPEGGQMLVDETLRLAQELWGIAKK